MNEPAPNPIAWDESWGKALARYEHRVADGFVKLDGLLRVVRQLRHADETRGLFAMTSHDGLTISPYSRYPDWFDGRRIEVQHLPEHYVRVRYSRNCYDPDPDVYDLCLDDAVATILEICRDHL